MTLLQVKRFAPSRGVSASVVVQKSTCDTHTQHQAAKRASARVCEMSENRTEESRNMVTTQKNSNAVFQFHQLNCQEEAYMTENCQRTSV